ncbi:nucleotidyltransferase family protein [Acholeplasma vituli]|uniref:Nucleotidyltransferase family protein n=1 Tax=Paracholeplasma vituli TaxID=69473 RepID=A0ABT2PXF2_9MOLU|nr:nucleotidyltransferase family protein [Paracholeplasma vituli]MCU0105641.1 nucleotidyltransferase family protein [Paracholeplasma vituli]
MNTIDQLLEASKQALNNQMIELKIADEPAFFKLMVSSGLSGVIIPALNLSHYSERFNQKAQGVIYQFMDKDLKQQRLIQKLRALFMKNEIDFIFLKGTKLKSLYKETYMRGMGDVDVLVRSDLDVIQDLFKKENIHLETRSLAHDHYHTDDGLIIEIHPSIHNDFNPKYQGYFKGAWEHVTKVSDYEYTLTPNFELVYLLYHLAKHVESSGIGLRSLLDIGIYRLHYEKEIDDVLLFKTLENINMTRFYNTVMLLNQKYFGLETKPIKEDFILSDDDYTVMTNYFVTSGIHGQGETFNPMAPRLAASTNKGKSKFRVLMRIIFPKMRDARGLFPVLNKHPYLYPFMIVYRNFKLLFLKRKSSIYKLKALNESDRNREEIINLFDKMGIY